MCRLLRKSNESGYTLIESLFQLMIFVILAQFILLFFVWKQPIDRFYANSSLTEWELFSVEFQQILTNVQEFEVQNGVNGIRIKNIQGVIYFEQNNDVIRKRVHGTGHVPYLTNVESIIFELNEHTLLTNVTFSNGTRKERGFVVGLYPE